MGIEMALDELTLVLFTTIAPSGAVAVALMVLLALGVRADADARARIDQRTWIPLAVTLVGLVASSTHLGNPANALYVLLGIGNSPLSNEVASAVVFLGLAGLYWLTAFSRRDLRAVRNVLACAVVLFSALFVTAVAFAYDADTILTWHTPAVPAGLWSNALCGGPLLAFVVVRWTCPERAGLRLRAGFAAISALGLVGAVVSYALQNEVLSNASNALSSGIELVPHYPAMIATFAALSACGWACAFAAPRGRGQTRGIAGCLLVFAGIFVARFAFYMMHLTV